MNLNAHRSKAYLLRGKNELNIFTFFLLMKDKQFLLKIFISTEMNDVHMQFYP